MAVSKTVEEIRKFQPGLIRKYPQWRVVFITQVDPPPPSLCLYSSNEFTFVGRLTLIVNVRNSLESSCRSLSALDHFICHANDRRRIQTATQLSPRRPLDSQATLD